MSVLAQVDPSPTTPAKIWAPHVVLGLVACIVGGLMAYVIVDRLQPVFPFADLPELGLSPSAELLAEYHAAEYAFRSNNGAVDCGILGACLGLLIGLLTSSARRVVGTVVGSLAGSIAGASVGYVGGMLVASELIKGGAQSLLQSTAYISIIWGVLSAAICGALATLYGRQQLVSALITGMVAGIVGGLAYNSIASILYPRSNLLLITPASATERLIWAMCISVALGLCLSLGMRPAKVKPRELPA